MPDFKTNATTAKIRAIYGKRLKHEDYKELVSLKSVSEIAEYLKKKTLYSEALTNIDTATIHRGFLESLLRKYNFERYLAICKFQQLDKKPFYNYLIVQSEVSELINIILHLNADNSGSYITSLPAYLMNRVSFDLMELAKIKSFADMLKALKHTPYANVLKDVTTDANGHVNFTGCEVKLRTYYLKWLTETAEKAFSKKSSEALVSQIKVQTDLINIINAYRMKCYFNMSADDIRRNMLPLSGRITQKMHSELMEANDREDFIKVLSKTIYGRQISNIQDISNDVYFEHYLVKLRYNLAHRSLMFSEDAVVSLYSVMYLFDIELENIVNIIEAVRYQKDVSYVESLLVTG